MIKGPFLARVFVIAMSDLFHLRFNIDVPIEDAERRFRNRIGNSVYQIAREVYQKMGGENLGSLMLEVQSYMGETHGRVFHTTEFDEAWHGLVKGEFDRCLQAIEGLHKGLRKIQFFVELNYEVNSALSLSEVDLGVSWKDGIFTKKGAKNLDDVLVNGLLHWLSDPKYQNVLVPFKKGLSHFLVGGENPERRGDAVTDMYEALEALAGIVTGRPSNDLASNRELFISKLGLPDPYKKMLKEYIDYGCQFRHALKEVKLRRWPSVQETEAFVYFTGIFTRLAIQPANS